MKRATLFICSLLVITLILGVFSGCSNKEYESGDFKYIKYGKGDKAYIEITQLTQEAENKRVLVVPERIDGIPVTAIRKDSFMNWGPFLIWNSNTLEKLYLPYDMCISPSLLDKNEHVNVFIISMDSKFYSSGIGGHDGFSASSLNNAAIFVDKVIYESKKFTFINEYPANVTYYYNFERADNNGVFWIDNVDEGALIIDIPPTEPIRERWYFGGWYTEPECINKWNFETDTVTGTGVDLYAKWL